jgi:hypothetical protein
MQNDYEYFEITQQLINENFSNVSSELTHQKTVNTELTSKNVDLHKQILNKNQQIT